MNLLRKNSKKRDAILTVLRSTKTHPTAQWVYDNVKTVIPNLSLATVYRNLKQLKDDGLIISVGVVEGLEHFDGFPKPHPHFICESCGCVIDLNYNKDSFNEIVADNKGNSINYEKTIFYGLCKNCIN